MHQRIYLDSAAAHPVRPHALKAFIQASKKYGNPSAPHEEGREARTLLEDARTSIARHMGAKADAVVFTSGATESNALGIVGYVRARLAEGKSAGELEVFYSPTQHASVIGAIEEVRALGVLTSTIPLADGAVDLAAFATKLTPATVLVTLDVVCGETGTLFDTRAVRRLLDDYGANQGTTIVLHVDATQAPLVEHMDRTRLGADLISYDAQKIGGVRGIGALIVPTHITLNPLIRGGGQERGIHSGTPSPALAQAFTSALMEAAKEREAFSLRAKKFMTTLEEELVAHGTGALINGGSERAPHILNLSLLGRDTDYLAALLDEAGIAVSTKSACEADAEGSRVVMAYTNDAKRASSTLRVSLNATTTKKEIERFIKTLRASVAFLDASQ